MSEVVRGSALQPGGTAGHHASGARARARGYARIRGPRRSTHTGHEESRRHPRGAVLTRHCSVTLRDNSKYACTPVPIIADTYKLSGIREPAQRGIGTECSGHVSVSHRGALSAGGQCARRPRHGLQPAPCRRCVSCAFRV